MQRFADRGIVVTGAASGIGRGTAERLASEGARLYLIDRDAERLAEVAACLPGAAMAVVDLADPEQVRAAAAHAIATLGQLWGLVNCAGTGDSAVDPWQLTLAQWEHVYAVNARAPFLLIQALGARLVEQRTGGAIVNIASAMARRPVSGVAYCSSKAALVALTQVWAGPLGRHGIRINAVLPGLIDTPIYHPADRALGQPPGTMVRQLLKGMQAPAALQIALARVGQPADIAGVVAFLLSEDAAYLTGQAIIVDGGFLYG
ncbi:MAG: SDR family oxidoreductase [Chloroflexi bacterium]|nr:SDR family oxidoreductase [Chloroflexota bacterium]